MTTGRASLYVHVPFCSRKCPYCHFYVLPKKDKSLKVYLEALKLEWQMRSPLIDDNELLTLYFGGGTPTTLGVDVLNIFKHRPKEITFETNPEDVTYDLMVKLKNSGVNRISIGVQSLHDPTLQFLGRTHSASDAIEAVKTTYKAGIENITIDLMYELPNQTFSSWRHTLAHLVDLPITHISLYNMTIEPSSAFYKHKKRLEKRLPDDQTSVKMFEEANRTFLDLGLTRYEISAWSKPGKTSLHNLGYWQARPFLGLGPSSFSYWNNERFQNSPNLNTWAKKLHEGKDPTSFREKLSYSDAHGELLAIGLRVLEGVKLTTFEKNHGPLMATTHDRISKLLDEGYATLIGDHLKLTDRGTLFYDSAAEIMI